MAVVQRMCHLRDVIEEIDQRIVDIWWRGTPIQTYIAVALTVANTINFYISESPLRYVAVALVVGIWLLTFRAYRQLYRAVKRYRRSWGRWPKFRGWL